MKTILITGATGSIGGATARELAKGGHKLILLGRDKQKMERLRDELIKESGNRAIEIMIGDLSSISSTKAAAREFSQKYDRLDALVNIAAVYKGKKETTKDGLEMMFGTNQMGPIALTIGLLDLLKKSAPSRVITVSAPSSTQLRFDDLQGDKKFSAFHAFGASKMANLMFSYALARKLAGTGVTSIVFHPGLVKTNLIDEMPGFLKFMLGLFSAKPDMAGKALVNLATAPEYEGVSGKFFSHKEKELKPATYALDEKVQEQLWKECERLLNK